MKREKIVMIILFVSVFLANTIVPPQYRSAPVSGNQAVLHAPVPPAPGTEDVDVSEEVAEDGDEVPDTEMG